MGKAFMSIIKPSNCTLMLWFFGCLFGLFSLSAYPASTPEIIERPTEQERILQIYYEKMLLSEAIIAYTDDGRYYLPLGEMLSLVEIPITVDVDNHVVEGWIDSEENRFYLNMATKKLIVGGKFKQYPDVLIEKHIDDIYVDSVVLYSLFKMNINVEESLSVANIYSDSPLPLLVRLQKEQRMEQFFIPC